MLDLSDNRLHRLTDGTFYGLSALKHLYVRGSRLVDVTPRSLSPLNKSLTYLNLADNRIQTIDFQTLAEVQRLTDIDLANNPWTCNCSLRRPADVGSKRLEMAWDAIVCERPPDARGRLLSSVLGQNSTVMCDAGRLPSTPSPFDFDDWRPEYLWIVTVVFLTCAAVVSCLVVGIHCCQRTRRSRLFTPC